PRFEVITSRAIRPVLRSEPPRSGCSTSPMELVNSRTSSRILSVNGLVPTARLSDFWNLAVAIICMVLVIFLMLRTALRRLTIARALAIGSQKILARVGRFKPRDGVDSAKPRQSGQARIGRVLSRRGVLV